MRRRRTMEHEETKQVLFAKLAETDIPAEVELIDRKLRILQDHKD
jgi:hypothetical protein